MKTTLYIILLGFAWVFTGLSEQPAAKPQPQQPAAKPEPQQPAAKPQPQKTLTKLSSTSGDKLPTDEEIKAFVTEYKETESSNESLSLYVRMGSTKKKDDEKKKTTLTQKVPYKLIVDLVKTKTVNNKKTSTRVTNGKCNVAILDAKGSVIKSSAENLIKLCAS